MLAMIVAVAENGVIGKDNQLIWHIPEDLASVSYTHLLAHETS